MARSTSVGRGALALAAGQIVAPVLAAIQLAVVARVLDPDELGTWVVPAMGLAAVALLLELGLHAVLARHPSADDRAVALRWSFMASVVHAAVVLGARAAGAPWWDVLLALVPVTILTAMACVGRARLAHASRFARAARVELEGAVVGAAVACALVAPIGIWALAVAAIARVGWIAARVAGVDPVHVATDSEDRRGSALSVVGAYGLTFVSGNVDYVLATSLLSTGELGVYFLAFNVAAAPATRIGLAANRIVVARVGRSDPVAVVGTLLVLGVAAAGALAASAGMLPTLLGDSWRPAVEPVRLLSVGTAAVLVGNGLRGIGIATVRDRRVLLAGAGVAALVAGAIIVSAPSDPGELASVVAAAQVGSVGIQASVVDRATWRVVREGVVVAVLWSVVALATVADRPWVPLALAVPIVARHLPLLRRLAASVSAR